VTSMDGYVDAFEEAGLLREFIRVLDYVDSTLAAAERYRPPSVIVRTLVNDGLSMLDDFPREYRGYVGKVMDYVCEELRSLLYEVFEECEGWKVSIAVHGRRWITLKLLHGKHHERFKGMKLGEARLVPRDDSDLYLNVAFRRAVVLPEVSADVKIIAVDVNENVIVYGSDDFIERFETDEGIIRTRYFLKRRRIQSRIRGRELRARLLGKYGGRERRRVREIYYKVARRLSVRPGRLARR